MTVARRRGFTLVEVLIVVVMASVLAAIAMPRFLQAQKRAKQSEAITNLKSLHAAMSTQLVMPTSIHVGTFDPPRDNRYSYHLDVPCQYWEVRSIEYTVWNDNDKCIAVDTYADPSLPELFVPAPIAGVSWDDDGLTNGMATEPGVFGSPDYWDYLAMAAGDTDKNLNDTADTWGIASADGVITAACSDDMFPVSVPAGEPFNVYDDKACDW